MSLLPPAKLWAGDRERLYSSSRDALRKWQSSISPLLLHILLEPLSRSTALPSVTATATDATDVRRLFN